MMQNVQWRERLIRFGLLMGMAWLILAALSLFLFSWLYAVGSLTQKDFNWTILFTGEFGFHVQNFPAGFIGNVLGLVLLVLLREGVIFLPLRPFWQIAVAYLFFVSCAVGTIQGLDFNSGTLAELFLDIAVLSALFALYCAGRVRLLSFLARSY